MAGSNSIEVLNQASQVIYHYLKRVAHDEIGQIHQQHNAQEALLVLRTLIQKKHADVVSFFEVWLRHSFLRSDRDHPDLESQIDPDHTVFHVIVPDSETASLVELMVRASSDPVQWPNNATGIKGKM
jgi:hypothetical protein